MFKHPRSLLQLIADTTDISQEAFKKLSHSLLYPSTASWKKFIRLTLLIFSVGLWCTGCFFFIAYNWHAMHPYLKLSLIGTGLIITILLYLLTTWHDWVKQGLIVLSIAGVGGMMMVFGQIYQTGANAYDLFLGWSLFVALWVIFQKSSAVWACWMVLLTVTIHLFFEQVYTLRINWLMVYMSALYFVLWRVVIFLKSNRCKWIQEWIQKSLLLIFLSYATLACMIGTFDKSSNWMNGYIVGVYIVYGWLIKQALQQRSLFQVAFVALSAILILDVLWFKWLRDSNGMLFGVASLFNTCTLTLLIIALINLSKKWRHESN